MDLIPNSDEQSVIDAAASFLSATLPANRLHQPEAAGLLPEQRRAIAELGWFGLTIPEDQGGHGMSVVEEVLVMRELGRRLGPLEVMSQCLAVRVAAHGRDRAKVEELVNGESGVLLAPPAVTKGPLRVFGSANSKYVLSFGGNEANLGVVASGSVTPIPSLDKSVPMGFLETGAIHVIGCMPATALVCDARLMCAAMQVGLAESVTSMVVEYAKIRETFGRAIGSYQAVRHPCADMHVRAEVARAQLFLAALTLRDCRGDASAQVNAAKVLADEAAVENSHTNIQLHGGIATTDEHDAHLFMKRAHVQRLLFGHLNVLKELLDQPVSA